MRRWFSVRILACHAGDRGSIPRQRKRNEFGILLCPEWLHLLDIYENISGYSSVPHPLKQPDRTEQLKRLSLINFRISFDICSKTKGKMENAREGPIWASG